MPKNQTKVDQPVQDAGEFETMSADAALRSAISSAPVAPTLKYKVKKNVTMPLLRMKPEQTYLVKLTSVITKAKEIKGVRSGPQADMAPPELVDIINLETGEVAQIIVPNVLGVELRDQYENDSYVGKSFSIVKHEKATGKRYATFSIAEIELE